MAFSNPDWLQQHGGSLRQAAGSPRVLVLFNGDPVYSLTPVPVGGKFGSYIAQVNSGKNVPSAATAETQDDAIKAGLEDLRKALGW